MGGGLFGIVFGAVSRILMPEELNKDEDAWLAGQKEGYEEGHASCNAPSDHSNGDHGYDNHSHEDTSGHDSFDGGHD
jgi:hypothetical protein